MAGKDDGLTVDQLADQYLDVLYRMAYRLTGSTADAQDLVQETFLTATRKLPQLRDPQCALAWLTKILRSCRRSLRSTMPMSDVASVEWIAQEQPPAEAFGEMDRQRLQQALDELPEEYREPLVLFYFEEFRYREIAEILDCPIGTVMSRLARAKSHLRNRLGIEPAAAGAKGAALSDEYSPPP